MMQSYTCNQLIHELKKAIESYQILKGMDQNNCGRSRRFHIREAMDLMYVPVVPMSAKRWAALNVYESLTKS